MAAAYVARELSTAWFDGARRRRQFVLPALVVVLSLVFARLVVSANVAAVGVLVVIVALAAVTARPRYGLYFMFAAVLFFDNVSNDPFMLPGGYLDFSLQTTLRLSGAILIPLEMLVLLTAAIWLAQAAMRRQLDFRPGFLGLAMLAFGILLTLGFVRGMVSGANPNTAFWESRFLFGMVFTYILATNTIRSRGHIRALLNLTFVCVGLSGLEAVWRKFALINTGVLGSAQELWFAHEDVVIWGLLVILVLAQRVFGAPRWQRALGPLLALVAVFAMLVSERRAGVIAVILAVFVFTASLVKINRKAFFLIAIPAILASAIYLPLFWNNTGTLGQGARAIRSISQPDPRDAASNAWRQIEAINVRATIASDPILGIGFGRPFLQVVAVPDISFFEFWNYEAHHNILWVWMKVGAFGFITFFVLVLGGIARSIWLARTLAHPELKTFALLAAATIVMVTVFCYVDLGLSFIRLPVLLGIMLGSVSVLERVTD